MTNNTTQQELEHLKETFNNAFEEFKAGFEGALLQLSKMADQPAFEPLEVGSTVKFIGPSEEYHDDVTLGKTYVISRVNEFGEATFSDDVEEHSYIHRSCRHLFKLVPPAPFVPETKMNNEQRALLVISAKEFISRYEKDIGMERDYGNATLRFHRYETDFVVKNNKVTALVYRVCSDRSRLDVKPDHVGRAMCMPGDVFNEWIGKAIALARALGIDIPEVFLNAVQPDEYAVGQVVQYPESHHLEGQTRVIEEVSKFMLSYDCGLLCSLDTDFLNLEIINDTNAEYEVTSK